MADPIFISFLLASLLISSSALIHGDSNEEQGFISVDISNKGLNFAKNLLVEIAESSLVPLELPDIKKSVDIPVVGKVEMTLSNVVINTIDVVSSTIRTGDTGILIAVSGATANLTMNWKYSYKTWFFPVTISDQGKASVQVEGMDIGLTLSLQNQQGSLALSFLECGCFVEDISINLDGGASWLYQGVLDAFEGKLVSAVEDGVSTRIVDGVVKLDSVLQSLPKEIQITEFASLNVTFIGDPVMSNSSVVLAINGLLNNTNGNMLLEHYHGLLLPSIACKDPDEMISIFLHENVIKSALSVYFKADKMHWFVDQVPDQSLLNTAEWRFIIPKLYKLYPNDDMSLNISVSSTPSIKIENQQIYVTIPADVIINVLDEDEVVPVACISVEITGWVSAKISSSSTLAGSVKLDHYTMSLKWSKIGNLHLFLVQTMMSALLRAVVLPLVNLRLQLGYHLPSFYGYELQNAEIFFTDSWITICSDVAPIKQLNLSYWPSLSTGASPGMYMV